MLYLGYDSSCSTCRTLARQVRQDVKEEGGKDFDIIALNDPAMARWRRDALGPDAPWTPTLVEVTEQGCVQGWTGLALGWTLVRRVGITMTARLATHLGQLRIESSPRLSEVRIMRRPFMRLAFGIIGGAALLGGTTSTASAAGVTSDVMAGHSIKDSNKQPPNIALAALRPLLAHDGELRKLLDSAFSRDDALIHVYASRDDIETELNSILAGSDEYDSVHLVNHDLTGGGTTQALAVDLSTVMIAVYRTKVDANIQTNIMIFEQPNKANETFNLLATSTGTDRTVTLTQGTPSIQTTSSIQSASSQTLYLAGTTAASGCVQSTCSKKGACYTCVCSSYNKTCVFNACGPCGLTCNPRSPWQLCLACAAVWCPAALTVNKCCTKAYCGWRESCA